MLNFPSTRVVMLLLFTVISAFKQLAAHVSSSFQTTSAATMVKKGWSVGSHVQWTFTWSISKKTSRPSPTVLGNNKLPFPSSVKKNHHTQIIHKIVKFALNGQEYRVRKRGYGPDRFGTARSPFVCGRSQVEAVVPVTPGSGEGKTPGQGARAQRLTSGLYTVCSCASEFGKRSVHVANYMEAGCARGFHRFSQTWHLLNCLLKAGRCR